MGDQSNKENQAKSKIEQIRIDLEKRLAAIENDKLATSDEIENTNEEIVNTEEQVVSPTFEISDKIEEVGEEKESTIVEEVNDNKEIISPISNTDSIVKEEVFPEEEQISSNTEDKKDKVTLPPKTIVASVSATNINVDNEDVENIDEEEDKKRGVLGYLIYALLIGVFLIIGYFYKNHLSESKKVENEIMQQKLAEFKNKRYLDSLELAELNNQIEDLQSNRLFDSISAINEQKLLAKSKSKKTIIAQKNFTINELKNKLGKNNIATLNNTSSKRKSNNNSKIVASNDSGKLENETNSKQKEEDLALNSINNSLPDIPDSKLNNDNVNEKDNSSQELKDKELNNDLATNDVKKPNISKPKVVKSPIYPGCEKKRTELDKKKCLTSRMLRFVSRKFNQNIAQNIGLKEGVHKARVSFVIDKSGYATVLNVRAENKIIQDEVVKVIQSLPKMYPKTINGKKSNTQYNIPITYNVEN